MRNAECGMRNVSGRSSPRFEPSLQFRIPHSAFRILLLLLLAGRAAAQADPSGSWRTLHTAHFRIHFRPAYREIALLEAREAERSYGLLATELHPPRGIVDLTLADDIDAANGFTTVFPTGRIVINAAPPAGDHGMLLFDDWLRLVTTHELTHVFHLDRTRGLWSGLQRLFGRVPGLFPNEYQPSWVIEGLATYYESKFTNGGRVRGSFHTQLLAADRAGDASRSPWNATLFNRWADGLVPYAYGSRFFHYLARAVGDSVVPRLVEATSGQLIPFRVGRQLSRIAPGRSLSREWSLGTRPPAGSGTPPPAARTLDSLLRSAPIPRVSPDGRRVVYLRDDGRGAPELRVLDVATLRQLAAHRVNGGVDYDWLGDTLLVVQLDFTSRWRIRSDLYRWVPGHAWRRATHGGRLVAPAAGGGRLAAIVLAAGSARPTIPTPVTPGGVVWEDVATSPDGRWVAGSRVVAGRRALVLWPADSLSAAAVLFETRGSVSDVVWTADGDLWFVADPTGFPQVYRWTDDAAAVPLTAEPLGARAPAPLGDGSLLYAGLSARGWELRQAPILRGAATPVAFTEPLPFRPAPQVPVSETGYTMWPTLLPHFWLPFGLNAGASGRFFGAVTAGADALDRFQYVADGFVAPHPFRAAGDLALVSDILGNPRLDLSASSRWLNLAPPTGAAGLTLSELDQDAGVGVTLLAPRWRRNVTVRLGVDWRRTQFATIPDTALGGVCGGCVPQELIGASVTLALARFIAAPLAISREDGFTWTLRARRWDERGSARWSNELRGQLDLYVHVPGSGGFAHHVVALRLAAGGLSGPLGAQYRVGGVSSGVVGIAFGQPLGQSRAFPVRGYRSDELSGARAASFSAEYRVPLALVGDAIGHLPLGADKVWLNLFADAGDAWAPGASPQLTRLRAVGLELAADLAASYDLPWALRLGVAAPLANPPSGVARRPQVYVALASDF